MQDTEWQSLRFFSREEFNQPEKMDYGFMRKLNHARHLADFPFHITSSYRDDDRSSAHYTGKAVDVAVWSSQQRYAIVQAAMEAGISRIGVYDRHVHLDEVDSRPQLVLWIGVSQ